VVIPSFAFGRDPQAAERIGRRVRVDDRNLDLRAAEVDAPE